VIKILGRQGMLYGFGSQPLAFKPPAGSAMQHRDAISLRLLQAVAQQVREQVVVSEPFPGFVKGHYKQIGRLQVIQHLLSVLASGHRVAQRGAQAVKNRGSDQKLLHTGLLAAELLTPLGFGRRAGRVAVAASSGVAMVILLVLVPAAA